MFTQCVVCMVSVAITLQGKTLMLNVEYKVQKEVCECSYMYMTLHTTLPCVKFANSFLIL